MWKEGALRVVTCGPLLCRPWNSIIIWLLRYFTVFIQSLIPLYIISWAIHAKPVHEQNSRFLSLLSWPCEGLSHVHGLCSWIAGRIHLPVATTTSCIVRLGKCRNGKQKCIHCKLNLHQMFAACLSPVRNTTASDYGGKWDANKSVSQSARPSQATHNSPHPYPVCCVIAGKRHRTKLKTFHAKYCYSVP